MVNAPISREIRFFLLDNPRSRTQYRQTITPVMDVPDAPRSRFLPSFQSKATKARRQAELDKLNERKTLVSANADAIAGFFYKLGLAKHHAMWGHTNPLPKKLPPSMYGAWAIEYPKIQMQALITAG